MPPLQWLGTLEARPSPLAQALQAVQPAVENFATWLSQEPERERRVLEALRDFLSSRPEPERQLFLQMTPPERLAELARLDAKHGGIVGIVQGPQGVTFLPSFEQRERERQVELQRILDQLSPLYQAPPEMKAEIEAMPEMQQVLQRARQVISPAIAAPDSSGVLRATPNFDVMLERLQRQAQTALTRAQAGTEEAKKELLEAQARETIARIDLIKAQVDQIRELTPAQRDQIRATTEHLRQQTADLVAAHPFIAQRLQAEIDDIRATIDVKRANVDDIRSTIEQRNAQTALLRQQLDDLKRTASHRYRQLELQTQLLEEDLNQARINNQHLPNLLSLQEQNAKAALDTAIENLNQLKRRGPVELEHATLVNRQLQQAIDQAAKLFPKQLKELDARIANMIKEGKQIDAQTALLAVQALLYKEQANLIAEQAKTEQVRREEIRKNMEMIDAQIWRIKELTPEEKEEMQARTSLLEQQLEDLVAAHPFIAQRLEAEIKDLLATVAVKEATAKDIQSQIDERTERINRMKYELDFLQRTDWLRYQQLVNDVARGRREIERIDAEIWRIRELTPEEKKRLSADTAVLNQKLQDMMVAHAFLAPMLQAELEDLRASIGVKRATADDIRSQIQERAVRVDRLNYELDWLKRTESLRYRQLENDVISGQLGIERAREELKHLPNMLRLQEDSLQAALDTTLENLSQLRQRGTVELQHAILVNMQLQQAIDQAAELFPRQLEELDARIANLEKEGKRIDAQTAALAAQALLYIEQAENIPKQQALQEFIAQNDVNIRLAALLVDIYRIDMQKQIADADREFEEWVKENEVRLKEADQAIQREQLGVERERTKAYVVASIGQFSPEAALEVLASDNTLTPEQKARIQHGMNASITRQAFKEAADYVIELIQTPGVQLPSDFDPTQEVAILTKALAGDAFTMDAFLEELEKNKAMKDIVDRQASEGNVPPSALAASAALVATAAVPWMLSTPRGQALAARFGLLPSAAKAAGTGAAAEGTAALGAPPPSLALPPPRPGTPPGYTVQPSGAPIPTGAGPGSLELPPGEPIPLRSAMVKRGSRVVRLSSLLQLLSPAEALAAGEGLPRPEPTLADMMLNWLNRQLGGALTGVERLVGSPYAATPEERGRMSEILQQYPSRFPGEAFLDYGLNLLSDFFSRMFGRERK